MITSVKKGQWLRCVQGIGHALTEGKLYQSLDEDFVNMNSHFMICVIDDQGNENLFFARRFEHTDLPVTPTNKTDYDVKIQITKDVSKNEP